jgi:tRNA-dihydrouridine synthase B
MLDVLYEAISTPGIRESAQINIKYLNLIGLGVQPTWEFLHKIRRATTRTDLLTLCREFLDHEEPMPLETFSIALNQPT